MYTLYSYLSWEFTATIFHGMHNTYLSLTQIYVFFGAGVRKAMWVQPAHSRWVWFSPVAQKEFRSVEVARSCVATPMPPALVACFFLTFPFSRAFARFDAMASDGSKDTAVLRSGISHRSNVGSDTPPGAFSNATAVTQQLMELRSRLFFFQGGDYSQWWIILFWLWRVLYQYTLPRLHHAVFFFSRRLSLCFLLCVTTFFRSNAPFNYLIWIFRVVDRLRVRLFAVVAFP